MIANFQLLRRRTSQKPEIAGCTATTYLWNRERGLSKSELVHFLSGSNETLAFLVDFKGC
jgi:hypothetical protein